MEILNSRKNIKKMYGMRSDNYFVNIYPDLLSRIMNMRMLI